MSTHQINPENFCHLILSFIEMDELLIHPTLKNSPSTIKEKPFHPGKVFTHPYESLCMDHVVMFLAQRHQVMRLIGSAGSTSFDVM